MVIAIGFAVVSSYAFSRYRFKGRNGIFKITASLKCILPQILSMFALFRLLKQMNMLDETGTGDYLCGKHVHLLYLEYEGVF